MAVELPWDEQLYHPPLRTKGPLSVADYRKLAAGDSGASARLSDDELVQELGVARRYEAWVTDPERWLRCWDHRVLVIGRHAIMAAVAPTPGMRPRREVCSAAAVSVICAWRVVDGRVRDRLAVGGSIVSSHVQNRIAGALPLPEVGPVRGLGTRFRRAAAGRSARASYDRCRFFFAGTFTCCSGPVIAGRRCLVARSGDFLTGGPDLLDRGGRFLELGDSTSSGVPGPSSDCRVS